MRRIATALLLLMTTALSAGQAQTTRQGNAAFPMTTNVDAQPLLSQVRRLREALTLLGEPLPERIQRELNAAAQDSNAPRVLRRVQQALDSYCLAAVHLPRGEPTQVIANPNRPTLFQQGWRPVLIKVVNRVGATAPLQIRSANARPLAEAPAALVASRWLDIESFNHPPLLPELSGLGLEYRLVSLYSRSAGTRPATLEFHVRRDDLPPKSSDKPSPDSFKLWTFRRDVAGWRALQDCRLSVQGDLLRVQTEANDPSMTALARMAGGRFRLRMRFRAEHDDFGQVFWATESRPQFDGGRQAVFPINRLEGQWQERSVTFSDSDDLIQVRIDLGAKAGRFDIAWIELTNESANDGAWSRLSLSLQTVPSVPVALRVRDERGQPATASFLIRDQNGRVFPPQTKRLAPDFHFHPQIYRRDGETLRLPAGIYTVVCARGPESVPERKTLRVGAKPTTLTYQAKRWIDPSALGWWSGDHHIHAAGCAHYSNPTEGVLPADMQRHIEGEDLKVGCNLTWGPCFDYQKRFFTAKPASTSAYPYLLRYDIEVSGFGSHQAGHLCLLRLTEQMYPGGTSKDHWTTVCLKTLQWAKRQGAVTGTAHSAIGLIGSVGRVAERDGPNGLPSYAVPPFDGIGAMEYIVDVTHEVPGLDGKPIPAVDFLATMDTDRKAELNIWYHTLNCGFRTRISGETDFPCISGDRVGMGRSYVKLDGKLDFDAWCEGIRQGRCYVSDGQTHLMEFRVNDLSVGEKESELRLEKPGTVTVRVRAAARRGENGSAMSVPAEVVVNGYPVAQQTLPADGVARDLTFEIPMERSGWIAVRVLGSAHTNPIFVLVEGKPIRASRRSVQWCLQGVEQCWRQKERFYAPSEKAEAQAAYDHARRTYRRLLEETVAE